MQRLAVAPSYWSLHPFSIEKAFSIEKQIQDKKIVKFQINKEIGLKYLRLRTVNKGKLRLCKVRRHIVSTSLMFFNISLDVRRESH
jgi:hypothetical protein